MMGFAKALYAAVLAAVLCLLPPVFGQSEKLFSYGLESLNVAISETIDLTPYNPPDQSTYTISPMTAGVTLDANNGRIVFKPTAALDNSVTLTITAQSASLIVPATTSFNVSFLASAEGELVRQLSVGYFSSYQFVMNAPMYAPVSVSGLPDSCESVPRLPNGLRFSVNGLTGTPLGNDEDAKVAKTYSLQCRTKRSRTNKIIFTTPVHDSLKQGTWATYYRYLQTSDFACTPTTVYNAFQTAGASIETQRHEARPMHTYSTTAISWDSANDLKEKWGVSWVGYINIPSTGEYRLQVNSDDGAWVFIDNEQRLFAPGCQAFTTTTTSSAMNLTAGYHHLAVHYYQNSGGNGFQAKVSYNNSPYVDLTDAYFYYAPPFNFQMTYHKLTMMKSIPMEESQPMTLSSNAIFATGYTIAPTLPAGLSLNPITGIMSGIPSMTTRNNSVEAYTITATLQDSTTMTTTLLLSVKDLSKPYGLYLAWNSGPFYKLNTRSIVLMRGWYFDYKLVATGAVAWAMPYNPTFLVGLDTYQFSPSTATISGRCNNLYDNQVIDIQASSSASFAADQTTTFQFTMNCVDACPNGYVPVEIRGNGYDYQGSDIDMMAQVETLGGSIQFGTAFKRTGVNRVVGACLPEGQYRLTGKATVKRSPEPTIDIYTFGVKFATATLFGNSFSTTFTAGTMTCAAADGFEPASVGSSSKKSCPSGQVGSSSRKCVFKDNIPKWGDIMDTCRAPIAPSNLHYGVSKIAIPMNSPLTLKPTYEGDVSSYAISPNPPAPSTIDPATGELTIVGNVATGFIDYTITASIGSHVTTTTIKIRFDSSVLSTPVIGLALGAAQTTQMVVNVPVNIQFTFKQGAPTTCMPTTALPPGLTYDITGIKGIPTVADPTIKSFSITCENDASTTNALVLMTSVQTKPLPGLLGAYSKLSDRSITCTEVYNAYSTVGSTIGILKVDTTMQHPYQEATTSWDGLTSEYMDNFIASWTGYIEVAAGAGNTYEFMLESDAGSWLYIDNVLQIDNSGCHGMKNVTKSMLLNPGYHAIAVDYFDQSGGDGILLYWKSQGAASYQLVSASSFSFVPASPFIYTYTRASYVVNVDIQPNQPLLFNIQVSSYSVLTKIPDGLSLNPTTGVISGKPTKHTEGEFLPLQIAATLSSGSTLTTIIYIAISGFQPPYDIVMSMWGSSVISAQDEVFMKPGDGISIKFTASGDASTFTLAPTLASSFQMSSAGVLNGTCRTAFSGTYTITAVNDGGRTSRSFVLTCASVCIGRRVPITIDLSSLTDSTSGSYTLVMSTSQLTISTPLFTIVRPMEAASNTLKYSKCVDDIGSLYYSISNTVAMRLSFPFTIKDTFTTNIVVESGSTESPITAAFEINFMNSFNPVKLGIDEKDKAISVYVPGRIDFAVNVTGAYTYIVIDPALPAGLSLSYTSDRVRISGTASVTQSVKAYSLTIGNPASHDSLIQFSIEVKDCFSTNQVPFSAVFAVGSRQDVKDAAWMLLIGGKAEVVFDQAIRQGMTYDVNRCISAGSYTLNLTSPSLGIAWAPGTLLTVSISSVDVGSFQKTTGSRIEAIASELVPLSLKFAVDPVGKWYYSTKPVDIDWYSPEVPVHGSMQESLLSALPNYEGNSIYLRRYMEDIPANDITIIGARLYVTHKAGCIVYINGKEVYRRFLPTTGVDYYTSANGRFTSNTEVTLFITRMMLNPTGNVIAIEYHRHEDDDLSFRALFTSFYEISENDCITLLNPDGRIVTSSGLSDPLNPASNAVDGNEETNWIELVSQNPGLQPTVTYSIGENKYFWFDTYGILTASDATNNIMKNPKRIGFSAQNDYETIDFTDLTFSVTSDNERKFGRYFGNYKLYHTFTLTIKEHTNKEYDTKIADMLLQACHRLYCPADGTFPNTNQGTRAQANCPPGYSGTQTRDCGATRYPTWNSVANNTCTAAVPSDLKYPLSKYEFHKGDPITYPIQPVVVTALPIIDYSIDPQLPAGIALNRDTGVISGTPMEMKAETLHTIFARNSVGISVGFVMRITVKAYVCPAESCWPMTERGMSVSITCPGGYSGNRERFCSDSEKPQWAAPVETQCVQNRNPDVPAEDEVYINGRVVVNLLNATVDSLFLDALRYSIVQTNPKTNDPSILLLKESTSEVGSIRVVLVAGVDNEKEISETLDQSFSNGLVKLELDKLYTVASLGWTLGKPTRFVGVSKGTLTLTITLSCVFGGAFLIFVVLCVYFRCRSRTARRKRATGSMKLGNSVRVGGEAGATGLSMRSMRGGDKLSQRAQNRSIKL